MKLARAAPASFLSDACDLQDASWALAGTVTRQQRRVAMLKRFMALSPEMSPSPRDEHERRHSARQERKPLRSKYRPCRCASDETLSIREFRHGTVGYPTPFGPFAP